MNSGSASSSIWSFLRASLVAQIVIGLILGISLAALFPALALSMGLLGELFVSALKAVAPILVLILVTAAIANHQRGHKAHLGPILFLYLIGTFLSAVIAVTASFLFPADIVLQVAEGGIKTPGGIGVVVKNLLRNGVDNPIHALVTANYIGILAWAVGLGIAFRHASETTKTVLRDCSDAVTYLVQIVIRAAPVGIFGLVAATIAETGFGALRGYAQLLGLLLGAMLIVALVLNPLMVFFCTRRNPYPLVFTCLRESGITAFFMRSSAANIPVNLRLCNRLGLNPETYSISIPLGATINMAGAAITITVMTLAAVHTMGISVDFLSAVLLSVVAAICACGASGVAGGSLLLIPLACSLFGIGNDLAMQVVGVGFIIGVIQDSAETALNSSTDVLFTAAGSEWAERRVR